MSSREQYKPGPAAGAQVHKDGERWTLLLVREMRHPPSKVWQALTDPTQLSRMGAIRRGSKPRIRGPSETLDGRDSEGRDFRN